MMFLCYNVLMIVSLKKFTMLVVSIAMFMDVMDANILNTAVPTISLAFHINPVDLKVALISYLLSFAIFIPTSGWVADRFGTKRIFISALAFYTLSSFFCGLSQSLTEIIVARLIQGIGGAFMISLGRLMIARAFPRNELVEAMNVVIMIVSLGVMLGPFIGGVIVEHWHWSWIFWINIPVGLILITVSSLFLKDTEEKLTKPFDFIGFVLFGGGLALLCFTLSEMSELNANFSVIFRELVIAIAMLFAYVIYALKKKENTLIRLSLFKIRTFRISVFGNLCARLGFGGMPFLLPLMQQISFGYSAQLAGLILVPIGIGIMISKPHAIKVLRKFGYKKYLIFNTIFVSILLACFYFIHKDTPIYVIAIATLVFGFFVSAQYTAMNSLAFADLPNNILSASTSITSTVQILGQTFGVAASAILLHLFSSNLVLEPAVFHHAFLGLSALTFISILIFLQLTREDGQAMLIKNSS